MLDKLKKLDRDKAKKMLFALSFLLLAFYVGGLMNQIFTNTGPVSLNPFTCLFHGIFSLTGLKSSLFAAFLFLILGGIIVY